MCSIRAEVLDLQDRKRLLSLAIQSIRVHLASGGTTRPPQMTAAMEDRRGVFVTLRLKGVLRGCVGLVDRTSPLWIGVRDMAIAAATKDTRFDPVQLSELEGMGIEISVLSDLQRISGPEEVRLGFHGIYLKKKSRTGLLLPQVAREHQWGPEQFLDRTSMKAGLPREAWREGAEIFVFSCEVFDDVFTDLQAN